MVATIQNAQTIHRILVTHNTQSASSELSEAKERTIASFAHFGGILGFLPSAAIYLKYRGRGTGFAEQEAREAMDFTLVPGMLLYPLPRSPGFSWRLGQCLAGRKRLKGTRTRTVSPRACWRNRTSIRTRIPILLLLMPCYPGGSARGTVMPLCGSMSKA